MRKLKAHHRIRMRSDGFFCLPVLGLGLHETPAERPPVSGHLLPTLSNRFSQEFPGFLKRGDQNIAAA
jgi:hypothetical protein